MSWWDELVTDDDLQKLFTAEYTGPGASELQDETSLGGGPCNLLHKFTGGSDTRVHMQAEVAAILAGKTIQEQQLSRQKFLFDKLSEATLSSYKVALRCGPVSSVAMIDSSLHAVALICFFTLKNLSVCRLFHRWASHQQKQEQSPAQQSWYIAHPDTKLDRSVSCQHNTLPLILWE